MRISDWSSDVCSSDLLGRLFIPAPYGTSEKRENHGWTSSRLIFAQIPTEGRFRCCSCLARAVEIVAHGIPQNALNIAFRFVRGDDLNPSQHVHPRPAQIAILTHPARTSDA